MRFRVSCSKVIAQTLRNCSFLNAGAESVDWCHVQLACKIDVTFALFLWLGAVGFFPNASAGCRHHGRMVPEALKRSSSVENEEAFVRWDSASNGPEENAGTDPAEEKVAGSEAAPFGQAASLRSSAPEAR